MTVDDIDASLNALTAAGGTMQQDDTEIGGGLRIALVKDASGNILGIRQAG